MIITLRLFFIGLIAFTPEDFQCRGDMRALLIDARYPPHASDGCPMHPHAAALFYQSQKCEYPCKPYKGLCRCDLEDELLDIQAEEGETCRPQKAPRQPAPAQDCEAAHFDDIPKLSRMRMLKNRMYLRRDCDRLCPTSSAEAMCGLVSAQVNFSPQSFKACKWSQSGHGSGGAGPGTGASEYWFKPLDSVNIWSVLRRRQKMPEATLTEVKVNAKYSSRILLEVAAFDGNGSYPLEIPTYVEGGSYYADLIVANVALEMNHQDQYERCARYDGSRDFEMYHDLSRTAMYTRDRAVPHPFAARSGDPSHGGAKSLQDAQDAYECPGEILGEFFASVLRSGDNRPICPQASVKPPTKKAVIKNFHH